MSLSDFQIIVKLGIFFVFYLLKGDGTYSQVYKVRRLEDNQEYALKKVKMLNLSEREKENALNEVRILASIKHKNVASYKQAFFDEASSSLCIVMEYADNGDVFQKICEHQQAGTFMKEKVIWKIFIQAVRGLKALHDLKILHRDMKSANIFLWKDYTAKLGDLNVSKVAKKGLLYTQTGTPYYASPEVWKDQPYDGKSDIWSLGCVLYETCALVPPFRADDMNGLFKKILKGQYPSIPSHYSMELRSVIKSLVQVNAASRPNTDQILEMPIVAKRAKKYFSNEVPLRDIESESELLKTIKFSKNLFKLKLPQATYEQLSFATIPVHNPHKLQQKNMRNIVGSKTQIVEKGGNLPKIGSSTRGGGNNHNNSTNSGDGDDEYEQDFEQEERKQQQQLANEKKPKSRSYSGRKDIELKNQIAKKNQLGEGIQQQASTESLPLASNRSKQNLQEEQPQATQQTKILSPKAQEKRGLSSSPSHQVLQTLDQEKATHTSIQQVAIVKPKKQIQKNNNDQTISQTIIEEEESEAIDKQSRNETRKSLKPTRSSIVQQATKPLENQEKTLQDQNIIQKQEKQKIKENAQSMLDNSLHAQRSREERKGIHMPSAKVDELPKIAQLSQSPSNMSLLLPDGSPLINHSNQHAKSLNPTNIGKPQIIIKPSKQQQQSPNFKRIVNIYSVNNYKKKKYLLNNNNSISSNGNGSTTNQTSANNQNIKGEDIKQKLQQLRDGMGYYDGKSLSTVNNRDPSIDNNSVGGVQSNNSVLLPELKKWKD